MTKSLIVSSFLFVNSLLKLNFLQIAIVVTLSLFMQVTLAQISIEDMEAEIRSSSKMSFLNTNYYKSFEFKKAELKKGDQDRLPYVKYFPLNYIDKEQKDCIQLQVNEINRAVGLLGPETLGKIRRIQESEQQDPNYIKGVLAFFAFIDARSITEFNEDIRWWVSPRMSVARQNSMPAAYLPALTCSFIRGPFGCNPVYAEEIARVLYRNFRTEF